MIRLSTSIWLVLIAIAGGALFNVSYQVGRLEAEKRALDRAITSEERTIRVLSAEWAYLNQPSRLAPLAARLTDLAPVGGPQLVASAAAVPLPLPVAESTPGRWETRIVAVAGVPGLNQVPLPRAHPNSLSDRPPGTPPAPAGETASPPPPPAPRLVAGGGAVLPSLLPSLADTAVIEAGFRFRDAAAGPGDR